MPPEISFDRPAARLVADLPGKSFALVMATGIVSVAAWFLGLAPIAWLLLALNAIAFAVLAALALLRLLRHAPAIAAELRDHRTGPGFLTIVAGTNVLGDQISLLTAHQHVAAALLIVASLLWLFLVYCFFVGIATRSLKPPLAKGIGGTWLLVVVAPESAAILGAQTAHVFASPPAILLASLSLYLLGAALYVVLITLIVYRWLFLPMAPEEFDPPYWINMGAAAITTLAGARLSEAVAGVPMLAEVRGYIVGETVLFWAIASWWIPLLAAVMIRRHRVGRVPLRYHFDYWAMVFPLGMYSAATMNFSRAIGATFLSPVGHLFFWLAAAAWCLTFFGMIRDLLGRRLSRRVW